MTILGFHAHQSGRNDVAHFGRLHVCDHQHLAALRGEAAKSGKKRQKEDEVMSSKQWRRNENEI